MRSERGIFEGDLGEDAQYPMRIFTIISSTVLLVSVLVVANPPEDDNGIKVSNLNSNKIGRPSKETLMYE
jgi:hypothetical protein